MVVVLKIGMYSNGIPVAFQFNVSPMVFLWFFNVSNGFPVVFQCLQWFSDGIAKKIHKKVHLLIIKVL